MFVQTVTIDQAGRITLPKQVLDALGVHPETEVVIELTDTEAVIKPQRSITSTNDRIPAMNLSVPDLDAESDFSDYLSNLEDYENRLARGEIRW